MTAFTYSKIRQLHVAVVCLFFSSNVVSKVQTGETHDCMAFTPIKPYCGQIKKKKKKGQIKQLAVWFGVLIELFFMLMFTV